MCVVGVDDDSAGEVPLACVIVKEGNNVTEQEIIKLVEGKTQMNNIFGNVSFPAFNQWRLIVIKDEINNSAEVHIFP